MPIVICIGGISIIADAPKITTAPKNQKVAENGIISFFCKASGNPAPEVYWRKGGKRITTTTTRHRYTMHNMPHGSVLRMEPVKSPKDDNQVECVAENGIGEPARAVAKLEIYAEGASECCCRSNSITFTIEDCGFQLK